MQELQSAPEATTLAKTTLVWARPQSLLAGCSLWLRRRSHLLYSESHSRLTLQELQSAPEGTTLAVDTLVWAGAQNLLAGCSLWLNGELQVRTTTRPLDWPTLLLAA